VSSRLRNRIRYRARKRAHEERLGRFGVWCYTRRLKELTIASGFVPSFCWRLWRRFAQSGFANPDFETGSAGAVPEGWFVPPAFKDFPATWVNEGCRQGKGCAEIAPPNAGLIMLHNSGISMIGRPVGFW
jgi:hypothetical protein